MELLAAFGTDDEQHLKAGDTMWACRATSYSTRSAPLGTSS
jgi:hypothetical protein